MTGQFTSLLNSVPMKKSIYNLKELESYLNKAGFGERDLRRTRRMFFREFCTLENMPWESELKDKFEEDFDTSYLKLVARHDSQVDGASKLLFETKDGKRIETVILRINTGRTSICVSSQVGCTEQCRFCSTGAMGFFRNLTKEEILDQVVQAGRIIASEDRKLRNIVFMGMGEPLRNYDNLDSALKCLLNGSSFQFANKFITVSSLGLPDLMVKFAEEFPQVGMALSLNGYNDESRSLVMPINDRYPMADIRQTLEKLEEIRGASIMIEYIMFDGINDSLEAADAVAEFLKGLEVHINLIPFNADYSDEKGFQSSSPEVVEAFQQRLKGYGYKVTRRFSLGQDIAAACGQLANKDEV
ncbi:MAG: 23S rRNA (adenine(2503)-C(2))-methyltransferase RlmN [Lentisphaeraceae bacterium]|nr:23S rRNA (adenine(2503)-C(2))-methyltransferase RlmN [Lentisphaeraceae bacterium]